jgi:hypothetical protein
MTKQSPEEKVVNVNHFMIKEAVNYVDLRTLRIRANILDAIAKRHKLKPGEAVVFTNLVASRFRVVVNIDGVIHLAIPGIDEVAEYKAYYKAARCYVKHCITDAARLSFEELVGIATRRKGA